MAEPLRLTDLQATRPGLRRAVHGLATSGSWRKSLCRVAAVCGELFRALPRDLLRRLRMSPGSAMTVDLGDCFDPSVRSVALYVHYAASGQISDMVLRQLQSLSDAGFAMVVISMAPNIPEAQWKAVRRIVALAVQRANFGLDFGAWQEVIPEVCRRWTVIDELMLANDSVLGPIHALGPVIDAMRSGGDGLFGLTESIQGGPHLQSYMLLARGPEAVRDLTRFLRRLYVSHSKWLLIQLGELRLARWMQRRRHRVAAVFGYDRVVRAALADPEERRRLMITQPALRAFDHGSGDTAVASMHDWPVNPTRHLWHVLATRLGYPFVKTDLVLRGLSGHPELDRWQEIVPQDAPCPLPLLRAHLDVLRPAGG